MLKSYRVGTVAGIPIRVDVTFLLVLPVFAWLIGTRVAAIATALNRLFGTTIPESALTAGATPWVVGLVAALGLFVGVILHELGHSLVAMRHDYEIESITLWLLGGVSRPAEPPTNWRHELSIAVAGPVVSVAIGVVCYLGMRVTPASLPIVVAVLGYLAVLNVVLAVFNMLPAFPLDGGRVLRALLSRTRSYVRATQQAATVGKLLAVLLGLAGLLVGNLFWVAIAFFVYIAAAAESKQTVLEATLEDVRIGDVMTSVREVETVPPDLRLSALLDRMLDERHTGYPVVDDGQVVGVVTLDDVQEVSPEEREGTTVADAMTGGSDLVTVAPDDDAAGALRKLAEDGIGRLLVTDTDGELVGLVTRTDLLTALEVAREQRRTPGSAVAG